MPLTAHAHLLDCIKSFNEASSRNAGMFLTDAIFTKLAQKHEANLRKRHVDLRFNLFAIVSELYYRENFHSDILKAILDPTASHYEETSFLNLFLGFIRTRGAKLSFLITQMRQISGPSASRPRNRDDCDSSSAPTASSPYGLISVRTALSSMRPSTRLKIAGRLFKIMNCCINSGAFAQHFPDGDELRLLGAVWW